MSPADSGEYVCQVVSSSGPLEASVLVNIEASGSSAVPVPGKVPVVGLGGWRREEGRGTSKQRLGARSSGIYLSCLICGLESQLLCPCSEMLCKGLSPCFPFLIRNMGTAELLRQSHEFPKGWNYTSGGT